jgi:hypothetical protein
MTKKELNLLQFSAIDMAELGARATEIVRCEMVQLHSLSAPSDHVPDDILRDPLTPRFPLPANGAEDSARSHLRRLSPSIDCILDPDRHGDGSNMTTLANQIHYRPVSLPDLQVLDGKCRQFRSAQSAANKHRNHRKITDTA